MFVEFGSTGAPAIAKANGAYLAGNTVKALADKRAQSFEVEQEKPHTVPSEESVTELEHTQPNAMAPEATVPVDEPFIESAWRAEQPSPVPSHKGSVSPPPITHKPQKAATPLSEVPLGFSATSKRRAQSVTSSSSTKSKADKFDNVYHQPLALLT